MATTTNMSVTLFILLPLFILVTSFNVYIYIIYIHMRYMYFRCFVFHFYELMRWEKLCHGVGGETLSRYFTNPGIISTYNPNILLFHVLRNFTSLLNLTTNIFIVSSHTTTFSSVSTRLMYLIFILFVLIIK